MILHLYDQQKYKFDNIKYTIGNRIVSISQPHIRSILSGKTKAPKGFVAKVEISVIDYCVRMEKLSWGGYNECESLIPIVEAYEARNGFYPKRVLANKIYRNRKSLNYCKKIELGLPDLV